jgi:hypothetical protein
MGIAFITLALSIISTSTFTLIFPIYQITFAQGNVIQSVVPAPSFDTVIAGVVSGGIIGAAASLIGTFLNNRHNMNIKKQEVKKDFGIELLKHRIDCYKIAFRITETVALGSKQHTLGRVGEIDTEIFRWYFQEGGSLLMSNDSLKNYVIFRDVLNAYLDPVHPPVFPKGAPGDPIAESAREFRGALQRDLGVREDT